MKRRLFTAAAMILVALPSCSDAVAPPDTDAVVGDTLLAGEPGDPAIGAIGDKAPAPAADDEVNGSFIQTRLTAVVNPTATVEQVNDALLAHDARISASAEGVPFLVLSIPPAAHEAAARALAADLVATGAFLLAKPEFLAPIKQLRALPASGDTGLSHLVPGRLPAAWNVQHAIAARARVVVPDWFHQRTPIASISPLRFLATAPGTRSTGSNHGFHVAGILAANHDSTDFTGAFPRADRIDVDGVSLHGLSWQEMSLAMFNAFPATGTFVLSTSLGYPSGPPNDTLAFDYAMDALQWRMLVAGEVDRFMHLTAASNEGDSAGILGQAFSSSPYNLARFQADLGSYVDGLDVPVLDKVGFAALWLWAQVSEPGALRASPNLLSVGSSDRSGVESSFSSRGSDVRAVGEDVYAPCVVLDPPDSTGVRHPDDCNGTRARYSGTSMATPLVAGIAAYLWSLESSLTPVQLRDILQDAYNSAWVGGVLDGYFAVQRLDQSLADGVMRRALLDVATPTAEGADGWFDEHDVAGFRTALGDYAQSRDVLGDPNYLDYSRYDLNGDGMTGDTTRLARFDLDADGTLGGATREIEGVDRNFDEAQVSDLDILCYYVYSIVYQGESATRQQVAPECSVECPNAPLPQGGAARSNHATQCVGPLPGVPPSFVDVESAGWFFEEYLNGVRRPGAGDCINDEQFFLVEPPVAWLRTGTCTFPDGSVTGTVSVVDDDRGRGSARAELAGRFQTTAETNTQASSSSGGSASHWLLITSDSAGLGTQRQTRARVALTMRVQVPAFANATCPVPGASARASFRLTVFGYTSPSYLDPITLERNRGCTRPPISNTSSGEVTDTLVVPIEFAFGEPIGLDIDLYADALVVGQHSQDIDAFAEVSYRFIDFLDLPPGSLVRVGSGEEWGVPTDPVPGPVWTTPAGR